jgi:hypothetical protein
VSDNAKPRCDFIRLLSSDDRYQELVACIDRFSVSFVYTFGISILMIHQEDAPAAPKRASGPTWLSWSHDAKHLSATFHEDKKHYEHFMTWLSKHPYRTAGDKLYAQDSLILMCLGIGLILRDLEEIQFESSQEGYVVEEANRHLQKSALSWPHHMTLVRECRKLKEDIFRCLGVEFDREDTLPLLPKPGESSRPKRTRGKGSNASDE